MADPNDKARREQRAVELLIGFGLVVYRNADPLDGTPYVVQSETHLSLEALEGFADMFASRRDAS